jgi:hypothetical protein
MQLQSMLIDRVSLPHLRSTTGFNRARYFQDYYLIDAEESIGDGFSFSGGQLVLYGEVSIGAPDIFSSPLCFCGTVQGSTGKVHLSRTSGLLRGKWYASALFCCFLIGSNGECL